jgi:hypothetical protein
MKFYTISNEDFAQILRDFRAYGTLHSNYLQAFGNFYLITSPDREVYHLVFSCAEFNFVIEYIHRMELAQVSGSAGLNQFERTMHEYFQTVRLLPSGA